MLGEVDPRIVERGATLNCDTGLNFIDCKEVVRVHAALIATFWRSATLGSPSKALPIDTFAEVEGRRSILA